MAKTKRRATITQQVRGNLLYQRAEENWSRGRLKQAFRFFLAAAKTGMTPAFGTLAQFYDQGDGVKVNPTAALFWYVRAYRSGDHSVANNIGCILRDKNKVTQALNWFRRAIRSGDDDANLNIAKIYLGKKRDLRRATHYLRKVTSSKEVTEGSKEEATVLLRRFASKG